MSAKSSAGDGVLSWGKLRTTFPRLRLPGITLLLCGFAGLEVVYGALRSGPLNSRAEAAGLLVALAAVAGAAAVSGWRTLAAPASIATGKAEAAAGGRPWRRALLVWAGLSVAFEGLVMGPLGRFVEPFGVRALAFWLFCLGGAAVLARMDLGWSLEGRLGVTALVLGGLHEAATYLPALSTYPLSMGWSEASRYYYGSLFLSERIYGVAAPPSVLHPSRYLLQALPFLFAPKLLWVHRAWQAALWLGLTWLTAWLLARRLRLPSRAQRLLFALWAFLYLFQGPILYHLLVPAALVLAGCDARRPLRSLAIVLAASVWAGISRVNWLPVPGLLAAVLYTLERELPSESRGPRGIGAVTRYLARPAAWVALGSAAALASQVAYMRLSGQTADQFGSSFTSDLLWHRLLPNPTFPLGILGGAALVSLPVLLLMARARPAWRRAALIRQLAIGGILAVLLAGGVLVSLKIGGGSNLHNLDAYLILLLAVGGYLFARRPALPAPIEADQVRLDWRLGGLAVAVPVLFSLSVGGPVHWPDPAAGEAIAAALQARIDAIGPHPRVLFIGERQLLTFGEIHGVELIPDYERVFLMEMAMGGNEAYLDSFHRALREQAYDLIVSDPLVIQFQGRTRAFGEENDVWVREVSYPVLCYYEPVLTYREASVQVLAPRAAAPQCPDLPGGGP